MGWPPLAPSQRGLTSQKPTLIFQCIEHGPHVAKDIQCQPQTRHLKITSDKSPTAPRQSCLLDCFIKSQSMTRNKVAATDHLDVHEVHMHLRADLGMMLNWRSFGGHHLHWKSCPPIILKRGLQPLTFTPMRFCGLLAYPQWNTGL